MVAFSHLHTDTTNSASTALYIYENVFNGTLLYNFWHFSHIHIVFVCFISLLLTDNGNTQCDLWEILIFLNLKF